MSIDEFNYVYNTVYSSLYRQPPSDLNYDRNNTVRMLESLGHCEFDYTNRVLFVGTPLLVYLPTYGLPVAVLTGARSPDLLRSLKQAVRMAHKAVRLTIHMQKGHSLIPEAVLLEAKDFETIKGIANTLKISHQDSVPAWEIINRAFGIDDILKLSDFEQRDELNWKSRVFSTKYLQFVNETPDLNDVRLTEYIHPVTQQRQHWFWRGNQAATVDRDFGRYIALAQSGVRVLIYDELRYRLAVPESVPLPRLFARALTLCTGFAPTRSAINVNSEFGLPSTLWVNVYNKIPAEIGSILSSKLSQKLIAADLEMG